MSVRNWRVLGALALVALAVLGRVALRPLVPPGGHLIMFDLFALMAIVAVLSGVFLGGVYSLLVPLSAMALSDMILGNGPILVFTWSGFVALGLLGLAARRSRAPTAGYGLALTGVGVGGVLAYDLWTNFGWWLLFYPHTPAGLAMCYAMAVPFMLGHMLSTAIALPLTALPLLYLERSRARVSSALRALLRLPAAS
ncbi:MAG: DUF6580 family putative transport protein [Thermoplasmatota archaeon]